VRRTADQNGHRPTHRIVVIGCGTRFSSAILPALPGLNVNVVSIIDPNPAARARMLRDFAPKSRPILGSMVTPETLANRHPHAAVIASPSGLHFRHAMSCLDLGLATFVEKPIACKGADAQTLRKLAANRYAASDQRIHRIDLIALRQLINDGRLGVIHEIRYEDTIRPAPHFLTSWRNDPVLAGGGVLIDLGYHTINTTQWLVGQTGSDISILSARLGKSTFNVEDHAAVDYRYHDITISIRVGLVGSAPSELLTVRGSKAIATISRSRDSGLISHFQLHSSRSRIEFDYQLDPRFDTQALRDFINDHVPIDSLDRHVATVEILDRIYQEAAQCRH
jgi:predicted dehydrogenase